MYKEVEEVPFQDFVETIYEDEDGKAQMQLTISSEGVIIFLHCDIYNWTKDVLKKCKKEFKKTKKIVKGYGVDSLYALTPNPKWCKVFGKYERIETIVTEDGTELELIEWDLA